MERTHGLGLRAQILLALSAAFLISFTALSVVVVQIAHKVQDVERARRTRATAEALSVLLDAARDLPLGPQLERVVGRADITGIRLRSEDQTPPLSFGDTR